MPAERCKVRLHAYRVVGFDDLPPAPDNCDYSPAALDCLGRMYLNDKIGCCVIASGYHIVGVETSLTGTPYVAFDANVYADYVALTGYDGTSTTDTGVSEIDAFQYWAKHGFSDGTKLLGWAGVTADEPHLKSACSLFENLVLVANLPDAWLTQVNPGCILGVNGVANPKNRHCMAVCGYNVLGLLVSTWGMIVTVTWEAIALYCGAEDGGDVYVLFTPDQLAKGQTRTPNGYAWGALQVDFDKIAGIPEAPPVIAPEADPFPSPPPSKGKVGQAVIALSVESGVTWVLACREAARVMNLPGAPDLDSDPDTIVAWVRANWTH